MHAVSEQVFDKIIEIFEMETGYYSINMFFFLLIAQLEID